MSNYSVFCTQCGQPKTVGLAHNCFQAVLDEMRSRDEKSKLQIAQLKYRVEKMEGLVEYLKDQQNTSLIPVQKAKTCHSSLQHNVTFGAQPEYEPSNCFRQQPKQPMEPSSISNQDEVEPTKLRAPQKMNNLPTWLSKESEAQSSLIDKNSAKYGHKRPTPHNQSDFLKPSRSYGRGRRTAPQSSSLQNPRQVGDKSMGSPAEEQISSQPMSTEQIQRSQNDSDIENPNTGALIRPRIPKLRKYVIAMLDEHHSFDSHSLNSILQQPDKEKSASVQRFGEMLYLCLQEYREEYTEAYKSHYSQTKITEYASKKLTYVDLVRFKKDLYALFEEQDVIGSLNYQNGFFSAFLVTDPYSREKLEEMVHTFPGNQGDTLTIVVKDASEDNLEVALQHAWSNGHSYILFE